MQDKSQSKLLLVDKRVIKFKKRYKKVLYAAPTLNNTICLLTIVQHRRDGLVHMDQYGTVLFQKIFEIQMDSFAALSQKQVLVLQTRNNNILACNLQQHKIINIPFYFKTYQTDQCQILTFPETQLVCIQENGRYNNNTFKLTYFRYPMVQNQEPLYTYEDDDVWNYQYMIRKGNNHSMVCWFKGRHDDEFQFRVFDLRDQILTQEHLNDAKIKHKVYKFPNDIGKTLPGSPKVEVALRTMWQMTPYKFMLVCITSLPNEDTNNNYVYEAKDGVLRRALFNFAKFNDLTIDQSSFGSTCMFRTFDFENGQPLQTPVYYINNQSESIIAQETWKCTYLYKYNLIAYEANSIVECLYENGNVQEMTLIIKKIMQPKQIYTHFLLQYYKNWHEDLLRNIIQLLQSTKI